jgi:hypothetical protein
MRMWAFSRSGSPPSAGQIPEGVGFAAANAVLKPVRRSACHMPAPRPTIVTRAESAACTCPEQCERDHDDE